MEINRNLELIYLIRFHHNIKSFLKFHLQLKLQNNFQL